MLSVLTHRTECSNISLTGQTGDRTRVWRLRPTVRFEVEHPQTPRGHDLKNGRNRGKPKSADGHSSDMRAAGIDFNPGPHAPGAAAPTPSSRSGGAGASSPAWEPCAPSSGSLTGGLRILTGEGAQTTLGEDKRRTRTASPPAHSQMRTQCIKEHENE